MGYSKRELIVEAHRRGFIDVTERQITEWVRLGLLDLAERAPRKDGHKGAFYLWPENQLNLLLTLLNKQKEVKHTSSLVVIPVSIWLYWGDNWVTTNQARRALKTSVNLFGPPHSWKRACANASDVVKTLLNDGAPRNKVKRLIDTLAIGLHSKKLDRDVLRPLLADLAEHDSQLEQWGPFGFDIDSILDMLLATLKAINELDTITDQDLIDARAFQRQKVIAYAADFPKLSKSPAFGKQFEKITLELLVERSCRDLLFQLGLMIIGRERGETLMSPQNLNWNAPPLKLIDWLQNRDQ